MCSHMSSRAEKKIPKHFFQVLYMTQCLKLEINFMSQSNAKTLEC